MRFTRVIVVGAALLAAAIGAPGCGGDDGPPTPAARTLPAATTTATTAPTATTATAATPATAATAAPPDAAPSAGPIAPRLELGAHKRAGCTTAPEPTRSSCNDPAPAPPARASR